MSVSKCEEEEEETKEKRRQRERKCRAKEITEAQTRNRKWQDWKLWGPWGPSEALEMRVCAVSSGCAQTVCVFDVDLTQLLESQTQSVHPDADRCAVHSLTSSETHVHDDTHTYTHSGDSNPHPSCRPIRNSPPGFREGFNKHSNIS